MTGAAVPERVIERRSPIEMSYLQEATEGVSSRDFLPEILWMPFGLAGTLWTAVTIAVWS